MLASENVSVIGLMVKKIKKRRKKTVRRHPESHVTPSMVNSGTHHPSPESGTTTVLQERASEFSISLHDREERVLDLGMFEACGHHLLTDGGCRHRFRRRDSRAGCKSRSEVYHHPWPGHFSAARNISLEYARNDWIF